MTKLIFIESLLCAKNYAKHLIYIISFDLYNNPQEVDSIIICILLMK